VTSRLHGITIFSSYLQNVVHLWWFVKLLSHVETLTELFLHQFCDAHSCTGSRQPFSRGRRVILKSIIAFIFFKSLLTFLYAYDSFAFIFFKSLLTFLYAYDSCTTLYNFLYEPCSVFRNPYLWLRILKTGRM